MKKLMITTIIFLLTGWFHQADAQLFSSKKNYDTAYIEVSSRCGMCKETIEKALAYERGVKEFNLDLTTQRVYVVYDARKTELTKIRTAINKVGYDADDQMADPNAYSNLPKCCKKEAKQH